MREIFFAGEFSVSALTSGMRRIVRSVIDLAEATQKNDRDKPGH
jgi:hypothetical protein